MRTPITATASRPRLDDFVDVGPGADRTQLLSAMKGHVLAKGELVGTYEATIR